MSTLDCICLFLGFCLLLLPLVLASGGVLYTAKSIAALRRHQLRLAYLMLGVLLLAAGAALGWVLLHHVPLGLPGGLNMVG